MNMRTSLIGLALACGLALSACSKATADNYAKLEAGMTQDQVHAILGKPDQVSGGGIGSLTMNTETWNGSSQTISVTFAGDKLALKNIEPLKQ
ncbi:MAG: outer membrane protein assembly factor BamE domain-containing protein [Stenotrophobium sp.]